jgi:hypothetical protein
MEKMVLLFIQMLVQRWLWNNTKQLEVAYAMPFCKGQLIKKKVDIYDVNQIVSYWD